METGEQHLVNPHPGSDEAGPEIAPGQEAPTPKRPPRFPAFDGLRAIAAITVVGVHTIFVSGYTTRHTQSWGRYTSRLEIGVAVFFLISGFLLYRPFTVSHFAKSERASSRAFWIRRLLRIVPAYWLALFVATTVLHAGPSMGPGGWKAYAAHYLFLQIYFPSQDLHGITAAWSLCVEMSFYLFIPFYAWWIGRRRERYSTRKMLQVEMIGVLVLIAISLTWRTLLFAVIGQGHPYARLATIWLPANIDMFALGMMLAILSAWFHHEDREPRFFSHPTFPWISWAMAGFCFWLVSNLGLPVLPLYIASDIELLRQTLYELFAFFLLLPAVFGPQHKGLIRKGLQLWPVAALGVISYGIYLWHEIWIYELIKTSHFPLLASPIVPFFLATMVLTIASSSISYFGLEKPMLRLKNSFGWFSGQRRKPPEPVIVEPPPPVS